MVNYFFITGCYRSGTTMLDKFLTSHSNCTALSQPITSLFIKTKELFHRLKGITDKKHLGIGSPPRYLHQEFLDFLSFKALLPEEKKELESILYQYQEPANRLADWSGRSFSELVKDILIPKKSNETIAIGLKEILCHEFIEHLLEGNFRVVIIIRNPRSMIRSLNYGQGDKFTGGLRPTLLNLRNWREVAEIAIRFMNHEGCKVVRYEDFISNPELRIKLLAFLSLPNEDINLKDLKNENGLKWVKNTSFPDQKSTIELDFKLLRYIDSICFFEMMKLGYSPKVSAFEATNSIKKFREVFKIQPREYYNQGYSSSPSNIEYELQRWRELSKIRFID